MFDKRISRKSQPNHWTIKNLWQLILNRSWMYEESVWQIVVTRILNIERIEFCSFIFFRMLFEWRKVFVTFYKENLDTPLCRRKTFARKCKQINFYIFKNVYKWIVSPIFTLPCANRILIYFERISIKNKMIYFSKYFRKFSWCVVEKFIIL